MTTIHTLIPVEHHERLKASSEAMRVPVACLVRTAVASLLDPEPDDVLGAVLRHDPGFLERLSEGERDRFIRAIYAPVEGGGQ